MRIPLPIQGINKNWSFSTQPQDTSPDMLNVRARSVLNDRAIIGQRPALVKAYDQQLGSGSPVVAMCQVTVSNENLAVGYQRKLVAASGNKVYYEDNDGDMVELSGLNVDTAKPMMIVEAYQKAIIVNDTIIKVVDFANTKLTSASQLVPCPTRNDILTQSTTTASMVVDFVGADGKNVYGKVTTSELFNTSNNVTSMGTCEDFTPSAVSTIGTPLYYDYTPYPDIDGGSDYDFGLMPERATIAALYRGRIFLAGDPNYPHQWYSCRQAFLWDWAYFANDLQSPVAGNDANAGELGDIQSALIAYGDNYFMMAGASSIWVLSGDPTNGTLRQISFNTGIWDKKSWCKDGRDNLYFLGTNGLYMIPAQVTEPINLTNSILPSFMEDWALDSSLHTVTMVYDQSRHGILINKTTISTGANENYWFDLRVATENSPGGFFPEEYHNNCGVHSSMYYNADDPDNAQVLLGCHDGYIRTFRESTKSDDAGAAGNVAIESHCLIAPFMIAKDDATYGLLQKLNFVTAGGATGGSQADTDQVTYQVFNAKTAEEVVEQATADTISPSYSGTLVGSGKAYNKRHRIRCIYLGIRLVEATLAKTWAIDGIFATVINDRGAA